ncbi:MAG: Nif3-like dinuclear metal center hexameric protein [Nitrosomonadaceae bacterium]|nr:Nif3-like dinuclear metal center hexameric protein [Nitrosospira sp.]MDW7598906.1 Nif3-like dinuclear metal center hexameric protein [Nitrosomonadaceae bacterium]MBI0409155.1 Nif3-like dinuclear metal center hexameric protein [Nitrosospira sp.]MBI0410050.1 Nif3-like dinuclear metal center hexameric protein [Nitrosospira sp.]MBI0411156.1 Nif3-like dinuclear metal center hexameric protein [Nitrosospira sp.]
MRLNELEIYLNQLLDVNHIQDYCPNGLQVEGRSEVRKLVSGVTASFDFLQAAVAAGADAVLVHHGYFWRGENQCLTGRKRRRIALLIENDISLFAYHLPLDVHLELGNNAQLGHRLGLIETGRFGEQSIAAQGILPQAMTLKDFGKSIGQLLSRSPLMIGDEKKLVHRIAWCTGAAQNYFDEAIQLGVDAFITGEISEQNVHAARESGVAFIAAGHHATERYGVQALGEHLAQEFGIATQFIDLDNPV